MNSFTILQRAIDLLLIEVNYNAELDALCIGWDIMAMCDFECDRAMRIHGMEIVSKLRGKAELMDTSTSTSTSTGYELMVIRWVDAEYSRGLSFEAIYNLCESGEEYFIARKYLESLV